MKKPRPAIDWVGRLVAASSHIGALASSIVRTCSAYTLRGSTDGRLSTGCSMARIAPGTTAKTAPVVVENDILEGSGPATIYDFSAADPADFPDGACVVLKGDAVLKDIKIIGIDSGTTACVMALTCNSALISGVETHGGDHSGIYVKGGSNVVVENCNVDQDVSSSYAYGIAVAGATDVRVTNCKAKGYRHGCTVGYYSTNYSTRVQVSDSVFESTTLKSADIHGGSTDCGYDGCIMRNGISLGGTGSYVRNCDIAASAEGPAIKFVNLNGYDVAVQDNVLHGDDLGKGLIEWDRANDVGGDPTIGTMRITGNYINAADRPFFLRSRTNVGADLYIADNRMQGTGSCYVRYTGGTGDENKFDHVVIKNNFNATLDSGNSSYCATYTTSGNE